MKNITLLFGIGILLISCQRVHQHSSWNTKNIQIARDEFGVPHIFGQSDADAAYGLAWAHAEDDFETIQETVAAARGVLAHYARGGREGHANQDGMIVDFQATEAEIDEIIAFLNSLTDETFLTNSTHADPWPDDHPARINRADP
jgi:hypothetical protein